ncbi:hypothetical protein OAG53_02135 [Akkermansiaceae bacterium]|nr:hypothetical protein [Akkermansiaceae bacterium]
MSSQANETSVKFIPAGRAPEEHPRFGLVHKMVLQGDPKDRIYKRLEVNGVTGDEADTLYRHAMKERVQIIRGESFKKILGGIGLIALAAAVFATFWFGLGYIQHVIFYLLTAVSGLGFILIGIGLSNYWRARSHIGSVADNI